MPSSDTTGQALREPHFILPRGDQANGLAYYALKTMPESHHGHVTFRARGVEDHPAQVRWDCDHALFKNLEKHARACVDARVSPCLVQKIVLQDVHGVIPGHASVERFLTCDIQWIQKLRETPWYEKIRSVLPGIDRPYKVEIQVPRGPDSKEFVSFLKSCWLPKLEDYEPTGYFCLTSEHEGDCLSDARQFHRNTVLYLQPKNLTVVFAAGTNEKTRKPILEWAQDVVNKCHTRGYDVFVVEGKKS